MGIEEDVQLSMLGTNFALKHLQLADLYGCERSKSAILVVLAKHGNDATLVRSRPNTTL